MSKDIAYLKRASSTQFIIGINQRFIYCLTYKKAAIIHFYRSSAF